MAKKMKYIRAVSLVIVLTFTLTFVTTAGVDDPLIYFTSNFTATGPSATVTSMEQALLDRLNAATTSIDVSIYDFNRVSIRDALIAAHSRGVTVRMVTDDDSYNNPDYSPHFQALETAGITVIPDNRSSIMHNKFFVIDGRFVWTGSTNITDRGFTYNHNNSILFDSSVLAAAYTTEFEEMFTAGLFGTAKSDNTTHVFTYDGSSLKVYFSPTDGALNQLISEVNNATSTIHFSIFSFTDDGLRDALISAKQRGVTVVGVWDSLGAGNQYSDDEALCAAGIPIKIENFGGILHNKFMVIDASASRPVVITGSMNWSSSGASANDENTVLFYDSVAAASYDTAWQAIYDALPASTLCDLPASQFVYLPVILTSTASSTPPANVVITDIVYNPPGDDVAGEYVRIFNSGGEAQDMSGWQLSDNSNHVYVFPAFVLQPGAAVNVWVKSGVNTTSDLYWGSNASIWNNTGDSASLKNSGGQLIDSCTYTGGGVSVKCN